MTTSPPASLGDIRVFDPATYASGDPATFGLPLEQYKYLREEAPCWRQRFADPLLVDETWVVSRWEDINDVDRDPELWSAACGGVNIWKVTPLAPAHIADKAGFGKPAMLVMDGEDHRRNRGTVSRAFTPKTVAALEERFRAYAKRVVDAALSQGGPFNFIRVVAHAMPMEALGDVLGIPAAHRPKFFNWVDTFASPYDTRVTSSFEELLEAIIAILNYAPELAELRRREPGDDVMSKIVQAVGINQLTDDEIQGNVALLAAGAAESTRSVLGHGMHQLMRDSEQVAWLRERADDIPATAVQELVRISCPFTHLSRTATRATELHGHAIKAGEKVAMLFASGNFDDAVFAEPTRFDLSRDPNPHLSFGRGPHSCLGKHVAGLEIKILLEELLQRTTSIEPAGEISYSRDNYSRGVYDLPVTVTPA
jgi:cholest-4-en-3-one 26-monooxygenase